MKKVLQNLVSTLSLFILSFSTVAHAQSVEQPKYAIGDMWEFNTVDLWTNKITQNSTHTVIGFAEEFLRVKYDSRNADASTGQLGKLETSQSTQRMDFTFTYASKGKITKRVNYAWPIQVGKSWRDEYIAEVRQSDGRLLQFSTSNEAVVEGWDDIETPVGKTRAIKVVHKSITTNTSADEAPSSSTTTYWYAPTVKR